MANSKINGAVRVGGTVYVAGQEAELAKVLEPGDVARLREGGAISGDWKRSKPDSGKVDNSSSRAGLDGVDFASDEAAEAASEAKLATADFQGQEPSGQGGYTKADVQKIAGAKQETK